METITNNAETRLLYITGKLCVSFIERSMLHRSADDTCAVVTLLMF